MASRTKSAGSAPKSASKGARTRKVTLQLVEPAPMPVAQPKPREIRTDQDEAFIPGPAPGRTKPSALIVNPAATAEVIACTATARASTLAGALNAFLFSGRDTEVTAYELATFAHPLAQEVEQLLQHLADMLSAQERAR